MQQLLPRLLERPIMFGHRGARAYAAENTLASFELALKLGATGLESDAWVTADGVVVLDHDGVVRSRLRKARPIASLRRDELPAHIPTLAELFERCGTAYELSLDVKDPAGGQRIVETAQAEAPELLSRLWLCHPSVQLLTELRSVDAEVKLVNSTKLSVMKRGPEERAATLAQLGIDAVNLRHTDWTGGLTALFHRFERVVFSWDLQYPRTLQDAFRMGVDGVFSDWPDRMVDALAASGAV